MTVKRDTFTVTGEITFKGVEYSYTATIYDDPRMGRDEAVVETEEEIVDWDELEELALEDARDQIARGL